jgi:hypothetical protein
MPEDVQKVEITQPIPESSAALRATEDHTAALIQHQSDANALRTEGHRKTNLIWERTQSIIALAVVLTTCAGVACLSIIRFYNIESAITFPPEWWTILGLVIGFYFGRTNHERVEDSIALPVRGRAA